jgi:hypothetical protein
MRWLESGDFAARQTSLNHVQARVDADGRVRIVAARRDPGVPNWIDVEDRAEGLLVYRYVGARSKPVPQARTVPLSELRTHLPAGHPAVGAAERRDSPRAPPCRGVAALHLMAWRPAARPQWVEELNAFGRTLGSPAALVPLDTDSLLAAAGAGGQADDFGDDESWRDPFAVFIRALDAEANLNLVGRLMARNEIVRSLRNRRQIAATLKAHPEIAAQGIQEPLLVTGTGRSGTSILHEVLAEDPAHRSLLTWEALQPCPPPSAPPIERTRGSQWQTVNTGRFGTSLRPSTPRCMRTAAPCRRKTRSSSCRRSSRIISWARTTSRLIRRIWRART